MVVHAGAALRAADDRAAEALRDHLLGGRSHRVGALCPPAPSGYPGGSGGEAHPTSPEHPLGALPRAVRRLRRALRRPDGRRRRPGLVSEWHAARLRRRRRLLRPRPREPERQDARAGPGLLLR